MHTNENPHALPDELTPAAVAQELYNARFRGGSRYWLAVAVLGALFVLGIVGIVWRLIDGTSDLTRWGYYVAMFGFMITVTTGAPTVAAALRFTKNDWSRRLARAAELWAIPGILMVFWMIPILFLIPPVGDRNSFWWGWPLGTPQWYDAIAVVFLEFGALALLWFNSIPDLAAVRDRLGAERAGWYGRFAMGWQGTKKQWWLLRRGLTFLSFFYLMTFFLAQTLVSMDFGMSLVPGWRSSIFPAFFAFTSVQAGAAAIIVTMMLFRWLGGYWHYFRFDKFWSMAKLLIPLSLAYVYTWWSEFLTQWYGRTPREQGVLNLSMFGPYLSLFIIGIVCSFLLPLIILANRWGRKTFIGATTVAIIVLIGSFADRLRIFLAAFTAAGVQGATLGPGGFIQEIPGTHFPDVADVLIIIGGLAGMALFYLLALKIFAPTSIWQMKQSLLLRGETKLLDRTVDVIAKPD